MSNTKNSQWAAAEALRIQAFICQFVQPWERVVVAISGGMDSDIVARLCCRSLGRERVKLFTVLQSDMEPKFLRNARQLAEDLEIPLAEISLEGANLTLMTALETGEKEPIFHASALLDAGKSKCSVRSAILSCYQDKGFLIAGATNRSEKELGFFLTFGDNLAHFKPLAHLYKSQLYDLARELGTRSEVLKQEPSAGFWLGQTDIEDLAYWIVNDGPILSPRTFSEEEEARVREIKVTLTYPRIDCVLRLKSEGVDADAAAASSGLSRAVAEGLFHIVEKARWLKNRELLQELPAGKNHRALS